MTYPVLTQRMPDAISPVMIKAERAVVRSVMMAVMVVGLGGCINLAAPDKPIEINLNINIKQEVVYRLDDQAKSLIKEQSGIF